MAICRKYHMTIFWSYTLVKLSEAVIWPYAEKSKWPYGTCRKLYKTILYTFSGNHTFEIQKLTKLSINLKHNIINHFHNHLTRYNPKWVETHLNPNTPLFITINTKIHLQHEPLDILDFNIPQHNFDT